MSFLGVFGSFGEFLRVFGEFLSKEGKSGLSWFTIGLL